MVVALLFLLLVATTHALSEGAGGVNYKRPRCIERERHALLSFKEGVVDVGNLLLSWNRSRRDCCSWRGIRCDNLTSHIIVLDLRPNFTYDDDGFSWFPLHGEIGSSLVELKHLRHLDLSYNSFTTIPKFIGSLTKLRYLNLSKNPVAGTIPSQLGNLTKLRFLDLSSESYSSLIADTFEWISHLPFLRIFTLSGANLTNAMDWFKSMKRAPSLTSLELSLCEFPVGVATSSLSHLNSSNSLKTLDVYGGTIHPSTVPLLLNLSRNLVSLTIEQGHMGGPLPDSFGEMNSLKHIYLWMNEFEGQIPKSLGKLCQLKQLVLAWNSFSGPTLHDFLKSRAASCPEDSLETLDMSKNKVGGSFPDVETIPTTLRALRLYTNRLTGKLPNLSNMSSLRELDISYNKLNGTLPESIGQLSNLQVLDVSSNSFTGNVSERHLGSLSKLRNLDLSQNSLTLKFPSNWVPPFQLEFLSLTSCKVGPEFPSWLQAQSNISYLDMSDSTISSAIPNWFFKLTPKLYYLDLSFNFINSTVPKFPIRSDNNPFINLGSNLFHGPIPSSLFKASALILSNNTLTSLGPLFCTRLVNGTTTVLDLSNNYLFGSLPDCWSHLKNLEVLNLENNKLSGMIPSSVASQSIYVLRLRHNNFSGNLPPSLKDCTELQVLDVGKNNLEGEIPSWIGERLTYLLLLQLKSNKFHGTIPLSLCHLQSIRILDLSQNHISGVIPSCLKNFTSMIELEQEGIVETAISVQYSYGRNVEGSYDNTAWVVWKGVEYEYDKILGLLRVVDLSSNKLIGDIPVELTDLVALVQLNLSRNNLSGVIPEKIGKLSKLESLDLSHNNLSGEISTGLAKLFSLDYLDLSHNRLSGRIPTSTQLQSLHASSFAWNLGLCGPPLSSTCPGDATIENPQDSGGDTEYQEWIDMSWFYAGLGVGFAFAYVGVCGTLFLKSSWRLAYFRFMNNVGDQLYVVVVVNCARVKRRFSLWQT